eukprot:6554588-Prymnesium_polylepis.1
MAPRCLWGSWNRAGTRGTAQPKRGRWYSTCGVACWLVIAALARRALGAEARVRKVAGAARHRPCRAASASKAGVTLVALRLAIDLRRVRIRPSLTPCTPSRSTQPDTTPPRTTRTGRARVWVRSFQVSTAPERSSPSSSLSLVDTARTALVRRGRWRWRSDPRDTAQRRRRARLAVVARDTHTARRRALDVLVEARLTLGALGLPLPIVVRARRAERRVCAAHRAEGAVHGAVPAHCCTRCTLVDLEGL